MQELIQECCTAGALLRQRMKICVKSSNSKRRHGERIESCVGMEESPASAPLSSSWTRGGRRGAGGGGREEGAGGGGRHLCSCWICAH